jgi:hypothetical protein
MLLDQSGSGVIAHFWAAIAARDQFHLKWLVLYGDGESSPSVETPIGDFFGLGLGKLWYGSLLICISPRRPVWICLDDRQEECQLSNRATVPATSANHKLQSVNKGRL